MSTWSIVLAAGGSRRLGRPKQLLSWGGRPLLERVVGAVATWPADGTVVVLGDRSEEILDSVALGDAVVLINDDWPDGITSSLRIALDFLQRDPGAQRCFVALADQPRIPPEVPVGLLAATEESSRPAIVPVYRYERSNPVLFDRSLWPRLMSMEGDTGAAELLRAHPEWVEEVRFDHLPPRDVDTEDDVADLLSSPPPG